MAFLLDIRGKEKAVVQGLRKTTIENDNSAPRMVGDMSTKAEIDEYQDNVREVVALLAE